MRRKNLVAGAVVLGLTALAGGVALSQDPDEKEMMMKLSEPGEGHHRLDSLVGTFTSKSKLWMEPGKPPKETTGTAQSEWTLGHRYLKTTIKGNFLGQPFEGIGTTGYDNYKKKYISTWIDTAGTAVMITEGEADASGKTITCRGEVDEPSNGTKTKVRTVRTIEADRNTYEMYFTFAGYPEEVKVFESVYERKK
jgi:hypothetical protein